MIFQRDKKIGVFYFFFSLSTVLTFLQFRQSFQNEPFSLEMNPQHPDCYLLILFVKELILQYKLIHDSWFDIINQIMQFSTRADCEQLSLNQLTQHIL